MKATKISNVNLVINIFLKAGHLKRHIHSIHDSNKDYKCEVCSKSFSSTSHLKIHIKRTHDGQKTNICEICGKSFVTTSDVNQHLKIVHGNGS